MSDPHAAIRRLERFLGHDSSEVNIRGTARIKRAPPVIRPEDCQVIATIVYDLEKGTIKTIPNPDLNKPKETK